MPDQQTLSTMMNAYGMDASSGGMGFNWVKLLFSFVFGIIGIYAFNYGRKEKNYKPVVIGIALMGYPYFVSNTILMVAIGVGLSAALYYWRD